MIRNKILAIFFLFTSFMSLTGFASKGSNCKILHKGTFEYGNDKFKVRVEINGNNHTEYHDGGKYIIRSTIEWISDCEYNMTMTEITIPNFPYKVGDVMNVKVNRVKGKEIFYTSTVQGKSWEAKLTKIGK